MTPVRGYIEDGVNPTNIPGVALSLLFSQVLVADTASIDTGAGGVAGGYNVLEIVAYVRTDEAVVGSNVGVTLNNDGGGNYDRTVVSVVNATVAGANALAATNWSLSMPGANVTASYYGAIVIVIPAYTNTSAFKTGTMLTSRPDAVAANTAMINGGLVYKSTSAISRVKIAPNTGGAKLKAGSALYVYGRS